MRLQHLGNGSDCPNSHMLFFRCKVCGAPASCLIGCGKRFDSMCEVCAKRWRRKTFKRYYRAINNMDNPKMMTLTRRKYRGGMQTKLMSLWEMRKRLFFYLKRKGYKIKSWIAVIEPPNHVHIIADMSYVPQWEIAEIWHKLTGDSFIVDIRALNVHRNPRAGALYITKYLSKASKWEGLNLDLLKGFHLIGSYGLNESHIGAQCAYCMSKGCFTPVNSRDFWSVVHEEFDGEFYGNFGLE